MNKVKKINGPTPQERADFIAWLMVNKTDGVRFKALELLARSSGNTTSTTGKWFTAVDRKDYRDCPYAVWRCWMMDYGEYEKTPVKGDGR